MSTATQDPAALRRAERDARNVWPSLAIGAIWLAVVLVVLFGPDITSVYVAGNNTTVPSGVVVALFAVPATWLVARYGFERNGEHD